MHIPQSFFYIVRIIYIVCTLNSQKYDYFLKLNIPKTPGPECDPIQEPILNVPILSGLYFSFKASTILSFSFDDLAFFADRLYR